MSEDWTFDLSQTTPFVLVATGETVEDLAGQKFVCYRLEPAVQDTE